MDFRLEVIRNFSSGIVENSVNKFLKKKFEKVLYIKKKLYFCIVKTNGTITKNKQQWNKKLKKLRTH